MEKKYEFSGETLEVGDYILHRIKAIRSFSDVKKGDLGGWIEKESNLSHYGNCWIYNNAKVFNNANVYGDAVIYADVEDNATITGDAKVCSIRDYLVFKNWWSSGRYFTWTRSNNMWKVGCFLGTGEELIRRAYADSREKGREYERIVKYVESIKSEIDK